MPAITVAATALALAHFTATADVSKPISYVRKPKAAEAPEPPLITSDDQS